MTKKLDWETQTKAGKAKRQGTESALADLAREFTPASAPFKKVTREMVTSFMREVALAQLERRPPPSLTEEMEHVFGVGVIGLRKLKSDARYQKILWRVRSSHKRQKILGRT